MRIHKRIIDLHSPTEMVKQIVSCMCSECGVKLCGVGVEEQWLCGMRDGDAESCGM